MTLIKKTITTLWLLTIIFILPSLSMARDIIFAPLPMEKNDTVFCQIKPMLLYLEQHLNSPVAVNFLHDYSAIIEQFQQDKIDLTFLGPLPYVQLRKMFPQAVPVVKFLNSIGEGSYTCSIITSVESGIFNLESLRDAELALTQPQSTCGYLSVSQLLSRAGSSLEENRYHYLGSHEEATLAVIRHEFAAGGVKTSIGRKYKHLGLRFLATTSPLPGFLLVANGNTLTPKQINTLREALLRLKPLTNEEHKKLTTSWGKNVRFGSSPVTDADYDVIRQALQGLHIPTTDKDH